MSLKIEQIDSGVEFPVKVVPSSRKSQIAGLLGDRLKIKVTAPPEDGRANAAVIALLSDHLHVSPLQICIKEGLTGPLKRIRVSGINPATLLARLLE